MRFEQLHPEHLLPGGIPHLTSITPALSESRHDLIQRLTSVANEHDTTVSFDVRFREGRVLCPGLI